MSGRWWKVVGLAGLAGVAATGVVLARNERRRRAYTPEEIRSRLLDRHAQAVAATVAAGPPEPGPTTAGPSSGPPEPGSATGPSAGRLAWLRRWAPKRPR